MGCDIHLYFERKTEDGWKEIDIPSCLWPDERNYALFGFLAGIYNKEVEAQFPDRGLPEDTSADVEEEEGFYSEFGTTHAYLDEILNAPWKENELEECYFYIFCEYVLPRLLSWTGNLSDLEKRNVRVLMGFDN